jgi:hypothetical protein
LPLAGPISNGDARRRKLREEGRNETGLSTAIDRTARNEGSTRGSATGRSTATAEYRKWAKFTHATTMQWNDGSVQLSNQQ